MPKENMPLCPKCQQMDSVQKVTTIVTGGTSTAQVRGYEVSSSTVLAQRLRLPVEQSAKATMIVAWIMLAMSICFVLSFLALLLSTFGAFQFGDGLSAITYGLISILCFLLPGILSLAIFIVLIKRGGKEQIQKENDANLRAKQRWNMLYYCHRDDVVEVDKTL